jgi:4-methylaminobutanoate oxidase (formaldehyde-forming)
VGDAALPLRQARSIVVAGAPVSAARISYAGELGWELTMRRDWAVPVWDALRAAGTPVGLEPFGYRALDALRMEKGYRYFGVDMTMLETPFEAGLGGSVRLGKERFLGRAALVAARTAAPDGPARRLATLLVGGDGYVPVYGGEAVRSDGRVIGRLRSVAYGPAVRRTIGYVYRSADAPEEADLTVDVFDQRIPASFAPDTLYDPDGLRMRG